MNEHYFSKKPSSVIKDYRIEAALRGKKFAFSSSSGVFSATEIDEGTRLLVENMQIGNKDDALDLGCGIGIVGIVAAGLTTGKVILTDVNERACKLAMKNSKGISNIQVVCGDMYGPVNGLLFDVILLNPPQTAGKEICFAMIGGAREHLKKGGSLQIVARHNKGGETLGKKMLEVFGNVQAIAKKGGFRVYMSRK